jgi:hypothetical protein
LHQDGEERLVGAELIEGGGQQLSDFRRLTRFDIAAVDHINGLAIFE